MWQWRGSMVRGVAVVWCRNGVMVWQCVQGGGVALVATAWSVVWQWHGIGVAAVRECLRVLLDVAMASHRPMEHHFDRRPLTVVAIRRNAFD